MNLKEHKEKREHLKKLEDQLINLIADSGNDELMSIFLKWQCTRSELNHDFVLLLEDAIKKHS